MSAVQDAMKTLTSQYYNAVVTGCNLNPATFQLIQAHQPLQQTSQALWNMVDAIPPLSVTSYYDPTQANNFSSAYGGIVNHLNPQGGDKFQAAMADYYPQWTAYLATSPTVPAGGMPALFQDWSQMHMPPAQGQTCYVLYLQLSQDPITLGVLAWLNMQHNATNPGVPAYNATIGMLQAMILSGAPQKFAMNSQTASADLTHTWAKVDAGGVFDFFWGGGSSSYEKWTSDVTSSGLDINVEFAKLVQFPAGPLAKPSSDPILSQYAPWYNSEALSIAYHNNNNVVWQHGAPTWSGSFGPQGNVQRLASALVIVDGITITASSTASIAKAEQQQFKTAIEGGFWPFFEASGSGGWTSSTSFNDDGSFSVTSKCVQGNPQILGVIVTPIGSVFALQNN